MADRAAIPILLLAAGASRRMGGPDKLLIRIGGESLLRARARAALGGGPGPVLVTLPPGCPERRAALAGLDVTPVEVPDAQDGMAASLRAGIAALPAGAFAALILLADTPAITPADIGAVAAAFDPADPRPVRGAEPDGRPGHPVLLPARLFGPLARLRGDIGARHLLAAEDAVFVTLPEGHATTDLDTPEDLERWRRDHP